MKNCLFFLCFCCCWEAAFNPQIWVIIQRESQLQAVTLMIRHTAKAVINTSQKTITAIILTTMTIRIRLGVIKINLAKDSFNKIKFLKPSPNLMDMTSIQIIILQMRKLKEPTRNLMIMMLLLQQGVQLCPTITWDWNLQIIIIAKCLKTQEITKILIKEITIISGIIMAMQ